MWSGMLNTTTSPDIIIENIKYRLRYVNDLFFSNLFIFDVAADAMLDSSSSAAKISPMSWADTPISESRLRL